jgi:hypothetical protein
MTAPATASIDLDEQAAADWILYPPQPESGVLYGGSSRQFESVANAVRFVIEQLPTHQRVSAHIRTDGGRSFGVAEIEAIYKTL